MASIGTKYFGQLRRDVVRMVHGVQSGHPGGSLGCADYFAALFFQIMHYDTHFRWMGKMRACSFFQWTYFTGILFALARSGYFEVKELASFRRLPAYRATQPHMSIYPV